MFNLEIDWSTIIPHVIKVVVIVQVDQPFFQVIDIGIQSGVGRLLVGGIQDIANQPYRK